MTITAEVTTASELEKRYTLAELKALGNVSHAFIYKQIREGKLARPEKWGRSSRWKASDVKAWLSSFASINPSVNH